MAVASRRFGDEYPMSLRQTWVRVSGVLMILAQGAYVIWITVQANYAAPFVAVPFVFASVFSFLTVFLSVVCNWRRSVPERTPVPQGGEPLVAIIVPTCGAPIPMVLRTVCSITEQDWPPEQRLIVISDDGHDDDLAAALLDYPSSTTRHLDASRLVETERQRPATSTPRSRCWIGTTQRSSSSRRVTQMTRWAQTGFSVK